jgi:DNA-binding NarL/FixJ family response regulator
MSSSRFPTGAPPAGENPLLGVASSVSQRPVRLLVVDDDPRVRQAIAGTVALEADLMIVAEANDAATALSMADGADPSVALVDVLLPDGATGLALVRRLDERPGCAVVAMSVRGGLRQAALSAGAVAFVEKGGDIDALLTAVRGAAAPRPA